MKKLLLEKTYKNLVRKVRARGVWMKSAPSNKLSKEDPTRLLSQEHRPPRPLASRGLSSCKEQDVKSFSSQLTSTETKFPASAVKSWELPSLPPLVKWGLFLGFSTLRVLVLALAHDTVVLCQERPAKRTLGCCHPHSTSTYHPATA